MYVEVQLILVKNSNCFISIFHPSVKRNGKSTLVNTVTRARREYKIHIMPVITLWKSRIRTEYICKYCHTTVSYLGPLTTPSSTILDVRNFCYVCRTYDFPVPWKTRNTTHLKYFQFTYLIASLNINLCLVWSPPIFVSSK